MSKTDHQTAMADGPEPVRRPHFTLPQYVLRLVIVVLVVCTSSGFVRAQPCETRWMPGGGSRSIAGNVYAMVMWDRDGPGPQSPVIVIGGNFSIAGTVEVQDLAAYDPQTGEWSKFGGGVNHDVHALAVLPNGDLIAGGRFTMAGGTIVNHIARWNGTNWSALGSGLDGMSSPSVYALAVLSNGDLVAGGNFTAAGGSGANKIARWDGTAWNSLGSGLEGGQVEALAVLPGGDVVAGGTFVTAGGATVNRIARWNGATWSSLDVGANSTISALAVLPNGDLVAGGRFESIGGVSANHIAQWNGASWSGLGSGVSGAFAYVHALVVLPDGELVVGGYIGSAGGVGVNHIARWDGASWSALGAGMDGEVDSLVVVPDGELVAGGKFRFAGRLVAPGIAGWNGAVWSPLEDGLPAEVKLMAVLPNGDLVAAGNFASVADTRVGGIARWDGSSWSALGSGMNDSIYALAVLSNGSLVAGGRFTMAGDVSVNRIARWDGTSWSALGSGLNGNVSQLKALPNGDLLVVGAFSTAGSMNVNRIARWDGTSWSPFGNDIVSALLVLPDGELIASVGGDGAGELARWDGTAWSFVANHPFYDLQQLRVFPNGDLVGSGLVYSSGGFAGRIARWDGTSWSDLGTFGPINALEILDGYLVAAFGGGVSRWDGTSWTLLGSGLNNPGITTVASALAVLANGDLMAGGNFILADGRVAPYLARWTDGGPPLILQQPSSRSVSPSGQSVFSVTTRQMDGVAYQWQIQSSPGVWVNLSSVPIPLPCGGSAAAIGATADGRNSTISINPCPGTDPSDPQFFLVRCMATNACGGELSQEALYITCTADFNSSDDVTVEDIFAFLAAYFTGAPNADVNQSGAVSVQDVFDFVTAYFIGCP